MKKKSIFFILLLAVLVAVAVLAIVCWTPSLSKDVNIKGYGIKIPDGWSTDSKGNLYNKDGEQAGVFALVFEPVTTDNATDFCTFEIVSEIEKNETEKCAEYTFLTNNGRARMYFYEELKNPEPYGAYVLFYEDFVRINLAKKIAGSFMSSELGKNPPQKNIALPNDEDAVIKISFEDDSTTIKNTGKLSEFAEKQKNKKDFGVNILCYREKDGKKMLESFKYMECDENGSYLYTYYENGEGVYTYDNNPLLFKELLKEINEEKNTTSYSLKGEEEGDVLLISFPLNRYRDNAKELVALKTSDAKSADIQSMLDKMLRKKEAENVSFSLSGSILSITFSNDIRLDEKTAYKHCAVLFSLAENIDKINISSGAGNFSFSKNELDKETKEKVEDVAENEQTFIDYTEKIEEESKPIQDGDVVYQGTVVISYDTKVTHPETGEKVSVGPYAESRGYGTYIGKPIVCTIKRSGNAYIASATCNGKFIMSYPLENEARLNWAINMIKSYS